LTVPTVRDQKQGAAEHQKGGSTQMAHQGEGGATKGTNRHRCSV
jgi:hypothetical protein